MFHELLIILIVFRFYADSIESNKSDTKLKIIGGLTVKNRSDFSYQVSLRYAGHHLCGGSIISESLILTAAHCCFHDKKPLSRHNLRVIAGDLNIRKSSNKTESRSVSAVYVHPSYDDKFIKNDIALWKVSPPFIWNENIQPVEISNYKVHTNAPCNVSGWGITDHENMSQVNKFSVECSEQQFEVCRSANNSKILLQKDLPRNNLTKSHLCRFLWEGFLSG
ncbi:serine protease 38-like isoform X2 [Coccinella septempunctata]|uniref:serine protease 38-like isoform X2 n=1 Tax=Coccinella septempunctata TaxID=41139 RepID=UPI001D07D525|nr:serine protease 38-like isoform X2 [Coccinella septempunctata]